MVGVVFVTGKRRMGGVVVVPVPPQDHSDATRRHVKAVREVAHAIGQTLTVLVREDERGQFGTVFAADVRVAKFNALDEDGLRFYDNGQREAFTVADVYGPVASVLTDELYHGTRNRRTLRPLFDMLTACARWGLYPEQREDVRALSLRVAGHVPA